MIRGKIAIVSFTLALLAMAGCAKTEREVSQSIMPAALNYYVLTQETARLRTQVKAMAPDRLGETLPKYRDIVARGQQMSGELAQMGEMRKHQDFLAALDSSLQTQMLFLQNEMQAAGAREENVKANAEIDRIERQISGNTLARNRHQAELSQLQERAQRSSRLIESLKPQLLALSRKNQGQMRLYNQMVVERKILTYTASESLLELFPWEQDRTPTRAASGKKTAKSGSKKAGRKAR